MQPSKYLRNKVFGSNYITPNHFIIISHFSTCSYDMPARYSCKFLLPTRAFHLVSIHNILIIPWSNYMVLPTTIPSSHIFNCLFLTILQQSGCSRCQMTFTFSFSLSTLKILFIIYYPLYIPSMLRSTSQMAPPMSFIHTTNHIF